MKTIYVSELKELQGKQFETVEALEKAEAEVSEREAAKQKAAEERKADAEVVKAAIIADYEADMQANEAKLEAYRAYLAALDEADKAAALVRAKKSEALKEFCKKHPEGFHETIKLGDAEYRYDYGTKVNSYTPVSLFDVFGKLFN